MKKNYFLNMGDFRKRDRFEMGGALKKNLSCACENEMATKHWHPTPEKGNDRFGSACNCCVSVLQTDAVDTGLTGPVEVLLDSMLEAVRQLLRRSGQTMDDLRGLRIFYLSQIFVQEDLHQGKLNISIT